MNGQASSAGTLLGSVVPRNRFGTTWLSKTGVRWQSVVDKSPLLTFAARHVGELIVVAAFIAVSTALFVMGDGIPYVTDNNETFSSLNHAYNLWHFDFFRSYGLADEAASPYAAAHPVVHTHQGNFPRLFAFLIYVLGARSAESQILVTTLTIGVASVLMAYTFFRHLAGALFATVVMLVFVTDYLMFAQWQVNTYRVWHTFFFFGALLCVHGYAAWRPKNWALATFFLYVGLFYWELVFAVFTALTAAFYTLWVYRRRWLAIIASGFVQSAGAVCGLAIVVTQLVLYLGWGGFLQDLTLTLTARNYAPDDQQFLQTLRAFYENRNIAFFYNLQSDAGYKGAVAFLHSVFTYVMQVPTPILSLLTIILASAALLSNPGLIGPRDARDMTLSARLGSRSALTLGTFVLFLGISDGGSALIGAPWQGMSGGLKLLLIQGVFCAMAAIAAAWGLSVVAQRMSLSGAPPSLGRSLRAGVYLFVLGIFVVDQSWLYGRGMSVLWQNILTPVSGPVAQLAVIASAALGALIILTGRAAMLGRWYVVPARILPFLICGALAFLVVYKLSAGYLHTGYLYRLCPLPVFFSEPAIGLGLFTTLVSFMTLFRRAQAPLNRPVFIAGAAAAAASALVFIWGWSFVQIKYAMLLPPNQFAWVKALEPPHLDGEGILSHTYATPFGIVARTWAYMRPPGGPMVPADEKTASENLYVWLADRHSNKKYWRPDFYVCFLQVPTLNSLSANLTEDYGCSDLDIVERATYEFDDGSDPKPEIIARDPVGDRWAILRLKWRSASTPDH